MTPLIKKLVEKEFRTGGDPTEMHWFDLTSIIKEGVSDAYVNTLPLLIYRPPFEKCAVVANVPAASGGNIAFLLRVSCDSAGDAIRLSLKKIYADKPATIALVIKYRIVDGFVKCYQVKGGGVNGANDDANMIFRVVAVWYDALSRKLKSYQPEVMYSGVSPKSGDQNRQILQYRWRTLVVYPSTIKSLPQGGSHASPIQHDRRGHLRRLGGDKNVWVKSCRVGDPSTGFLFKDYKIKSDQDAQSSGQ